MKRKLLIIDDSETNLMLIESVFKSDDNIDVYLESQGKNALAKIIEIQPHLIILDLMMPEVDGFEVLRLLKSNPDISAIPVLVVSAKRDQATVDRVMGLGASRYIKKPISLPDVENQIREIIGVDHVM